VATHDVTNQVPPLAGYDVFGADHVLVDALARWGDAADRTSLHELGTLAGSATARAVATSGPRPTTVRIRPPAVR
jgi:putative acyl-CoA dehydrogenase